MRPVNPPESDASRVDGGAMGYDHVGYRKVPSLRRGTPNSETAMLKPIPHPSRPSHTTRTIGFLLVPQFSMIAFTSAIEPFRLANRLSGEAFYDWKLYSAHGRPVRASNDVEISV